MCLSKFCRGCHAALLRSGLSCFDFARPASCYTTWSNLDRNVRHQLVMGSSSTRYIISVGDKFELHNVSFEIARYHIDSSYDFIMFSHVGLLYDAAERTVVQTRICHSLVSSMSDGFGSECQGFRLSRASGLSVSSIYGCRCWIFWHSKARHQIRFHRDYLPHTLTASLPNSTRPTQQFGAHKMRPTADAQTTRKYTVPCSIGRHQIFESLRSLRSLCIVRSFFMTVTH